MIKILHVVPYFDLYPPKNGGTLRCYHLNQELAKYFDVTLLTMQSSASIENTDIPHWNKNVRIENPLFIPKTKGLFNRLLNAFTYRWYRKSLKGPSDITFLAFFQVILKLLQKEKYDFILYEHLHSISLAPLVKRLSPKTIQIIDQHNVDHLLYAQEQNITRQPFKRNYERFKTNEGNLYKKLNLFFACSEKDRIILEKLNGDRIKGHVIANGTDTIMKKYNSSLTEKRNILFCGSLDYKPNKEAILWFFTAIWPIIKKEIPEIELTIVGRNGKLEDYSYLAVDPQVNFIGEVIDVKDYYDEASISIVPLKSGSGTRLKILEAMSYGIPVISTTIGAEGIEITNGEEIIIADDAVSFVSSVIQLIQDRSLAENVRSNARKFVEAHYSWEIIGKKIKYVLEANLI